MALTERVNWLGYRVDRDPFGKLMLKAGVSRNLIKEWSDDLQVTFGVLPMNKSIFDILENMTSDLSRSLPIDRELRRCHNLTVQRTPRCEWKYLRFLGGCGLA